MSALRPVGCCNGQYDKDTLRCVDCGARPVPAPTIDETFYDLAIKERDYERLVNTRLRAEVEALQNNYYRLCLWAIDRRPGLPDHSCAECVPNSGLIIHDYRCAYHAAKAWAALAAARRELNE